MKIALVGHGHLGKWHAEKINSIHRENFHSIVEVDQSRHDEIREKYPNVIVTAHLKDVLSSVDSVAIVTPTTFHHQLVVEALGAGKNVFVEKPMTSTLEQSIEIKNLLEKSTDLIFQVGHSERFHSFWSELMEKEDFSKVKMARFDRLAPYKGRGDDVDIIFDLMIHDYDLINMLGFGEPISISAYGQSCHTKMIDYTFSTLDFGDRKVCVSASRSSATEKRSIEFVFPDGILEVDLMNGLVRRSRQGEGVEEFKYEKRDHLFEEHLLFKQSIESGSNNELNIDVGLFSMKMLDLTFESIRENKTVSWK